MESNYSNLEAKIATLIDKTISGVQLAVGQAGKLSVLIGAENDLANVRLSVLSPTSNIVKTIDDNRKVINEMAKGVLASCFDAMQAVEIARNLAPTIRKADNAQRKWTSKRRALLCKWLKSAFSEYDFSVDAGLIVGEWCGNQYRREATTLVEAYERLVNLGYLEGTQAMDIDDIASTIEQVSSLVPVNIEADNSLIDALNDDRTAVQRAADNLHAVEIARLNQEYLGRIEALERQVRENSPAAAAAAEANTKEAKKVKQA